MPTLHETAYPRLKSQLSEKELREVYTPTQGELALTEQVAREQTAKVGFLVLLKTFQRLGYFILLRDVPTAITDQVLRALGLLLLPAHLGGYDESGARLRHIRLIRRHLGVHAFAAGGRERVEQMLRTLALTKQDTRDLINGVVEMLVRDRFELPSFTFLEAEAERVRAQVHRDLFSRVFTSLGEVSRERLSALFTRPGRHAATTQWNDLKREPGRPTLSRMRDWLAHQQWLAGLQLGVDVVRTLPEAKLLHFAEEAGSLDAARMQALEPHKRFTLMACFLHVQHASALDDLAELFVRRMGTINRDAQAAFEQSREDSQERVNALVSRLKEVAAAYQHEGTAGQRLAVVGLALGEPEGVIDACEAHEALLCSSAAPFVWRGYASSRTTVHSLCRALAVTTTSQDVAVQQALQFVLETAALRQDTLILVGPNQVPGSETLDLSWIPDGWWRLVTGQARRDGAVKTLNRHHFEACVMTQVREDLKSGDLCVPGSHEYADYRDQLVSDEIFQARVLPWCEASGLPRNGAAFVSRVRDWLQGVAQATDASFPGNEGLRIEKGQPVITKIKKKLPHPLLKNLEVAVKAKLAGRDIAILDAFVAAERGTGMTRPFGPLSGFDSRLVDASTRYVTAIFCYGCNLGPSQTARSLAGTDRKQLEWVNRRHVTEQTLDQAITQVINAYAKLSLPGVWGTGERVSADGTKWNIYEENLLAEYHLRYGGYGGIGYYHVSDRYIALYSHFIPCGVYEARYILDGLLRNDSDLQPTTVHADTHGQSTPVFAIAYLLGIDLMPRIRDWKHLVLYRPEKTVQYDHIDELFGEAVNWSLIEDHYDDLLRVCVSIQAGRIFPSTILKRLGSAGRRRNRLYLAFRELGRAVRTAFLLRYLGEPDLRATIHAAVNKSEQFNAFQDWIAFGGDVIATNDRDEQRKRIKYNHLAANCVIFHTACLLTEVVKELLAEGHEVPPEALAGISPYLTEHINRLGDYTLNLDRVLEPDYDFKLP
ncbi:Tn3 family transposase [Deinococcus sp.]|uniref:Tn3 family transposase n=1 Tax=Deinococcus sp. TaxID=47478 RepID=UPI0025E5646B|nr:Tn3 family transposase [Deinococcus sp.]